MYKVCRCRATEKPGYGRVFGTEKTVAQAITELYILGLFGPPR